MKKVGYIIFICYILLRSCFINQYKGAFITLCTPLTPNKPHKEGENFYENIQINPNFNLYNNYSLFVH